MNFNDIIGKILLAVSSIVLPFVAYYVVKGLKIVIDKIQISFIRDQAYNLVWAAEQIFEDNIDKFTWVDKFLRDKLKIKDPDQRRRFIEEAVLSLKAKMSELLPKKGGKNGTNGSHQGSKVKPKNIKK